MNTIKKIFIIDDLGDVTKTLKRMFILNRHIEIKSSKSNYEDLFRSFEKDFSLIFINKDGMENDLENITNFIKEHLFYLMIPVVVLSSDKDVVNKKTVLNFPILTYVLKPFNKIKFKASTMSVLGTLDYNLNIDDVSGFPCTHIIERKLYYELKHRTEFSFLFLDLDNFKDFNEYYGLKRGNDILTFFSGIMKDVISELGTLDDFIGHVGGDDFVMILKDYRDSKKICEEVIRRFENGVRDFYDEEDIKNDYIEVTDRTGKLTKFPIMGISICVIKYDEFHGRSFDEVYKDIMVLKKEVKDIRGSAYLIKE